MKTQATVRILLHSLFLRKNLIIVMNVVILATILIGSLLIPSIYQAESSLMLLGRNYPDLLTPGPRNLNFSQAMMNTRDEINSEIEVIRSRPVLEKTVKVLRLDEEKPESPVTFETLKELIFPKTDGGPDKLEAAINNLKNNLKVDPAVESQIMLVRYRSKDPAQASQIVNTVVDEYLKQHLVIYINHAESAFYAEQIKNLQANLKTLQDQLIEVKTASGIISFSDQAKALLAKLQNFDQALANVQKEMISSSSKLQRIHELRKTKPDMLIPLPEYAQDAQIMDLENKLVNLKFQQKSVLQRYTPQSRQYTALLEQLTAIQNQIRNHVTQLIEREQAKLMELQAEEQSILQTMQGIKESVTPLPATEVTLVNLQKEIDNKQEILGVLWKKYQDSLINMNNDGRLENVKVLSPASVPTKPVYPNLLLNLGLGFIFALIISFSTAIFLEYWDDSLKLPEQVEKHLGVPVLASIPEL